MKCLLLVLFCLLIGCTELSTQPSPNTTYQQPPQTGDGWLTGNAAEAGLSVQHLAELSDRISDGSYRNIHSVLLVRAGRLVFEEYYPGTTTADKRFVTWGRDSLHAVHSVTKSVTSALIGIAIDRGLIENIDIPVSTFFPEYEDVFVPGDKGDLTLRHLLTMTAGLEFDEHTYSYYDSRNSHVQMNRSEHPIEYTLHLPLIFEPGMVFKYNSGLSLLLGETIRRVSGLPADEFAATYLFEPLGIEKFAWYKYPDGTVQTGGGLALRPRDMARIGQLYLNGGTWGDDRLISQRWIEESTTIQVPTSGGFEQYGLHWWIMTIPRHDNVFDLNDEKPVAPAAVGWGGQWVLVYPDLDLVAVFTAGNDSKLSDQPVDIMRRFVFPAFLDPPSE